jgi:hypothetical protein
MSKEKMDPKPAPGFANGDRHGWISTMCGRLERVAHGRAAEEIIASGVEPGRKAVVALPMWAWVPAGAAAGRKGDAADGGKLLLPLRLSWSSGSLLVEVPPATDTELTWSAVGRGRSIRGTLEVCTGLATTTVDGDLPPDRVVVKPLGQRPRKASLARFVEDGKAAWWEIVFSLEGWVGTELKKANSKVSAEMASSVSASISPCSNGEVAALSEQSLEALSTHMLFGSEDRPGSVPRLIDKCLSETFARVDPLHFTKVWLGRDAEEVVRVGLGDLKFGGKVRRLLAGSGATSPEEFMAIYRETYPADRLGIGRLERALLVGSDPMAAIVSIDMPVFGDGSWEKLAETLPDLSTLDQDQFDHGDDEPALAHQADAA